VGRSFSRGRYKTGRIDGAPSSISRPGQTIENALIKAFNGRLRDECLKVHQFASIAESQPKIEAWRVDCSQRRPHSSLGHLTPNEFLRQRRVMQPAETGAGSS
jgi:putative transposase